MASDNINLSQRALLTAAGIGGLANRAKHTRTYGLCVRVLPGEPLKMAFTNLAFAGDLSFAFELAVCFTLIRRVNPRRVETDICDFGQPSGMADPSASVAG